MNVQNTEARNVFTERSEHGPLRPVRSRGGTLGSFAKAQVQKRKEDWLSPPVVAAAAVNPIYSFAFDEEERWAVPGADAARGCYGPTKNSH